MSNTSLSVVRKPGKELTFEEAHIIQIWRKKLFNSESVISPKPRTEDWEKMYFLLYNQKNKLAAFARIHEITILFQGKRYDILGTAMLVAIEQGKGYGALVKNAMKEYALSLHKTSIGICNPKLSPYYESLGYGVVPNLSGRFYQITDDGTHKQFPVGKDLVYTESDDKLITKFLKFPKESILSYRYTW